MKPICETLEEAKQFFLNNITGSCYCEKPDGEGMECNNYLQAEQFFNN